jgi:hypothetical protein
METTRYSEAEECDTKSVSSSTVLVVTVMEFASLTSRRIVTHWSTPLTGEGAEYLKRYLMGYLSVSPSELPLPLRSCTGSLRASHGLTEVVDAT